MNVMQRIKAYHMVQATLAVLTFVIGELGIIHAWLGYCVAIIIVFRLLWSLSGERQLGLGRFHPVFDGINTSNFPVHPAIGKILILGIALSLIGSTVTGIALDKDKSIEIMVTPDRISKSLITSNNEIKYDKREHRERQDSFIDEIHEFFANLMIIFVAMHITYMVLLKWPIAKFMCSFQKMSQPCSDGPK